MRDQQFPPGWDEKCVSEVLAHYEHQTDDQAVAEIEAGQIRSDEEVNDSEYGDQVTLTPRQQRVVDEILRIAKMLGVDRLSQNEFDKHHKLGGLSTAGYQFGTWNRAVKAAGLQPYETCISNVGPKLVMLNYFKKSFDYITS